MPSQFGQTAGGMACRAGMEWLVMGPAVVKRADQQIQGRPLDFTPRRLKTPRDRCEAYVWFLLQAQLELCDKPFTPSHL